MIPFIPRPAPLLFRDYLTGLVLGPPEAVQVVQCCDGETILRLLQRAGEEMHPEPAESVFFRRSPRGAWKAGACVWGLVAYGEKREWRAGVLEKGERLETRG